jgi:hypothetical protein
MIVAGVVLVLLNLFLSVSHWISGAGFSVATALHPVTVGLVGAILLVPRRQRNTWRFRLLVGIPLGYLVGFSLAEGAIQYVYARPFTPRSDLPMIRSLLQLTLGPIGPWADRLAPFLVGLLFVMFFSLGVLIVHTVAHRLPEIRRRRRGAVLSSLVLVGTVALSPAAAALVPQAIAAWGSSGRLTVRPLEAELESPAARGSVDPAPSTAALRFPGLLDRDIYVFAVEAYGYATVSQPHISTELEPHRRAFRTALEQQGYQVASSFLRSPVAGGFSWLAEATFLTGQWIDSQTAFEELYDARLPSLSGVLQRGGYHTFTVRPGTVHGSWPEAWDLYRFEDALVAYDGDFDFHGPWFSYVPVTDQYAIWRAHRYLQEATAVGGTAADRPFLAYYQLVSSHTPFNAIPPLIDDWNQLGDGSIYHRRSAEIRTFDNTWTGGTELVEGYTAAIAYVFDTMTAYINQHMDLERRPIVIVFGDHQAQRPIREQNAHLSVPIHVASADAEVLQRFLDRGFEPGMVSSQAPPHRDMSDFFPLFLDIARD